MPSLVAKARRLLDEYRNSLLEKADLPKNELIDRIAYTTNTSPTDAQKASGNYRKGKFRYRGLQFVIENPRGSTRSGVSPDGERWASPIFYHYGYIARTEGSDSDQIDFFLGPNIDEPIVYVIDQVDENGQFDETKSMVGFSNLESARVGYLSNYPAGWNGIGAITAVPFAAWRDWIMSDKSTEPVSDLFRAEDGELAKEKTFKPNASMRAAAKRGLELRRKYGKGGTAVGVARARDIINGKGLSLSTVKRMRSFFARHDGNQKGGENDAGYIAWLLWGSGSGRSWANNILRQEGLLNKEDDMEDSFRTEVDILSKEQSGDGPLYVYGAAWVPDKVDRQNHVIDADTICKAARDYMINAQHAGLRHKWLLAKEGIQLTQSFIAPSDMQIGEKDIPKGSWVVEFRVTDDTLKKSITSGQFNAFSVGGRAKYAEIEDEE